MIIELDPDWTPSTPSRPQGIRRRHALSLGVAASLILTLVLGGSARPGSALKPLLSLPAGISSAFVLAGDRLLVATDEYTTIAAYQLPRGRALWRVTLPDPAIMLRLLPSAGVVLAETGDPTQLDSRVLGLDAGTGRELWEAGDADLVSEIDDPRVLLMPLDPGGSTGLRSVDPRTGIPRWSVDVQPPSDYATGIGWLVLRSADGRSRIVDEDTGRVTATRQLDDPPVTDPLISTATPPHVGPGLFVVGKILFATYLYADTTTVIAYRADALTRLWLITVDDVVFGATDCGPVLCLHAARSLIAVDPVNGGTRWHSSTWADAAASGTWLTASAFTSDGHGRLALLDPGTGAVHLDLANWSPIPQTGGDAPALLASNRVGRLGTWVALTRRDATRIQVVGWLPNTIMNECRLGRTDRTYLVCPTHTGPVRVWVYQP
jgi:outer membrane protein assembly factor BamB